MSKFEEMRAAIERHAARKNGPPGGKPVRAAPPAKPKPPVAAAAKPKSDKPGRSAKARDERAKRRGRLPFGYSIEAHWYEGGWVAEAKVSYATGPLAPMVAYDARHRSDGLFRLMEEMDVMFWEWVAANPDDAAKLKWPEKDERPEPYPSGATDK